MKVARATLLTLAIIVLGTASCIVRQPPQADYSRSCVQLQRIEALRVRALALTTAGGLRGWIAGAFALPLQEVELNGPSQYTSDIDLHWHEDEMEYRVMASNTNPLGIRRVLIGFEERPAAISHLVGCLGWGVPDYYNATWGYATPEGKRYELRLFFTARGVEVATWWHYTYPLVPEQAPTLNGNLPVQLLVLVSPGPIERVDSDARGGVPQQAAQWPKPWPGSWDKLTYEAFNE